MLSFKNCNIYLSNEKIVKSNLTIKDGKFDSLEATNDAITLNDKYIIVPGFIEQHIHGSAGCDVMDCKETSLHTIAKSMLKDGITSWLPTTMTMPKKDIINALEIIANTKQDNDEAKIQGINLEGPFISKQYKGAQDDKHILTPNVDDMLEFVQASKNKIRITTVAVENADADFMKFCKLNNIVVSLGHSAATANDFKNAVNNGLTCTTHTFNAMNKSIENDSLVSAISKSNIYSEIILDLFHVPVDLSSYFFKNKKDKIILVSDSMEGRYMPDGQYKLGTNIVYVKNGQALLAGGKKAGSILRLPQALKNVKQVANLSIEKTIDMVAKNPANNLGLKDVGCIKQGNWADFVIIDKDFNIYQTYINGKLVYDSKKLN